MDYAKLLKENRMSLIMSLPGNNPRWAKIAIENGADVVKVHANVHHHASNHNFGSLEEEKDALLEILSNAKCPCGIVVGQDVKVVRKEYEKAIDMGFSFISLYARHTPLQLLREKRIQKMIAFDDSYELGNLPELEKCNVNVFEASVMNANSYGLPLSLDELIKYKRICKATNLPVVVPTQREILPEEVAYLAECGVKGIMIGAIVTGKSDQTIAKSVKDFRKAIDELGL